MIMPAQSRPAKQRVFRPMLGGIMLLSGALGTTGASLTGHQIIAIATLAVTVIAVAGEQWIAKRRDDLFRRMADDRAADPAVLRALTIHEAVRSGLLSSEDTVRLLRDDRDHRDDGDRSDDDAHPDRDTTGGGKGGVGRIRSGQ